MTVRAAGDTLLPLTDTVYGRTLVGVNDNTVNSDDCPCCWGHTTATN